MSEALALDAGDDLADQPAFDGVELGMTKVRFFTSRRGVGAVPHRAKSPPTWPDAGRPAPPEAMPATAPHAEAIAAARDAPIPPPQAIAPPRR